MDRQWYVIVRVFYRRIDRFNVVREYLVIAKSLTESEEKALRETRQRYGWTDNDQVELLAIPAGRFRHEPRVFKSLTIQDLTEIAMFGGRESQLPMGASGTQRQLF